MTARRLAAVLEIVAEHRAAAIAFIHEHHRCHPDELAARLDAADVRHELVARGEAGFNAEKKQAGRAPVRKALHRCVCPGIG